MQHPLSSGESAQGMKIRILHPDIPLEITHSLSLRSQSERRRTHDCHDDKGFWCGVEVHGVQDL